jgi:hypothetical protein
VTEIAFTAGITLHDNRVITIDVRSIDGDGIGYSGADGPQLVPWTDVKAVMLATTDHMLENGGYLFSMAELVEEREQVQPYDPAALRRLGAGILRQAAPLMCPRRAGCGLRPGFEPIAGPSTDG